LWNTAVVDGLLGFRTYSYIQKKYIGKGDRSALTLKKYAVAMKVVDKSSFQKFCCTLLKFSHVT
jgi:hypothetical protein